LGGGAGAAQGRGQVHPTQSPTVTRPRVSRRRSTMLRIRARLGMTLDGGEGDIGTAGGGSANNVNGSPATTIGLRLDHMSEEEIDSRLMTLEEETELESLLSPAKRRRAMREAMYEVLARQELDRARQERRRRRRELKELKRRRRMLEQQTRQRIIDGIAAANAEAEAAQSRVASGDGETQPEVVVLPAPTATAS
jgi:hypothetical protein